ncbi:MAG TPA: nucleoside deaminase [Candidatus Saccharimonadales bacterium]|jgi:tRNA(Arg) A34 adenosine deaminase TadA
MAAAMSPDTATMERAIQLARDNYQKGGHAIAAVIIKDSVVISEAYTTIILDNDPTAHAEMNAIRAAADRLGSRYLDDCYLYTTYEPCPMCTSAAIWAKCKGIVYGASHKDETPQAHWRVQIPSRTIIESGTPTLELYEEFLRNECRELLTLT